MPLFIQLTDRFNHPILINFQWVNQIYRQGEFTVVSFNGGDEDIYVTQTPDEIFLTISTANRIRIGI